MRLNKKAFFKKDKLLCSTNMLYIVLLVFVANVIQFLHRKDYESILLFIVISVCVYLFNKNILIVMLIPLLLVNTLIFLRFVFNRKSKIESFTDATGELFINNYNALNKQLVQQWITVNMPEEKDDDNKVLYTQFDENLVGFDDEIIREITKKYNIEKRDADNGYYIFTIDNDHSNDHDDGLSWNNGTNTLSIYIANVALVIDYLGLWDSFSTRIATMYLPDRKRPMLPSILSECLCSLKEGQNKLCFVLDITIEDNDNIHHELNICNAKISKNHIYKDVLNDNDIPYYSKIKSFFKTNSNMEVVHRSMMYMNHFMSKFLLKHETGIFKNLNQEEVSDIPESLPSNVSQFIQTMRNNASSYVLHDKQEYKSLQNPKYSSYLQTTSPNLRLVD